MTNTRRHFLRVCGGTSAVLLAGCAGNSRNEGSQTGGQTTPESAPSAGTDAAATHRAKLTAEDGDSRDYFGSSVAVSDDGATAIVGAVGDGDPNGDDAGAAYVFDRSGGSWSEQAKLAPEDGDTGDEFGCSVAVSSDGTTALVGAVNDENPDGEVTGSMYVFSAAGGSWTQRTKLTAADGDDRDAFGASVAVSNDGTTSFVGAPIDEDPNGLYGGSAYVFDGAGESWDQQSKLAASDGDTNDEFGRSVAVSGDGTTALVGAQYDEDPNGKNAGAVYVFEATGESWRQQAKFAPDDGDTGDEFGTVAVSNDGTTALVGAPLGGGPSGPRTGAAYVFSGDGGSWSQQAKLTPDDGNENDQFGSAIALSDDGTAALVGAKNANGPDGTARGAAYAFTGADGSWSRRAKLTPDNDDFNDLFGTAVALSSDGTTALVGATGEPDGDFVGSTYVFRL